MGCDIRLSVEFKKDNKWHQVLREESEWPSGECDSCKEDDPDRYYHTWCKRGLYGTRYSKTFAVLADVRNKWIINPISMPRGFPEDASDTWIYANTQDGTLASGPSEWNCSYSHHTLSQL